MGKKRTKERKRLLCNCLLKCASHGRRFVKSAYRQRERTRRESTETGQGVGGRKRGERGERESYLLTLPVITIIITRKLCQLQPLIGIIQSLSNSIYRSHHTDLTLSSSCGRFIHGDHCCLSACLCTPSPSFSASVCVCVCGHSWQRRQIN